MPRIGFIADVHLHNHKQHGGPLYCGLNDRAWAIRRVLEKAVAKANELKCDALVVCGDLFDTDKPTPQIVAAAMDALGRFENSVFLIVGNHDQSSDSESDHAFAPFEHVKKFSVIEGTASVLFGDVELVLCAFRKKRTLDWLPQELERQAKISPQVTQRVLALHVGVSDNETPPWLVNAHDAIDHRELFKLMHKHNVQFTAVGNWHAHRWWRWVGGSVVDAVFGDCDPMFGYFQKKEDVAVRKAVVQCGALVPTGWNNPGVKPYGSLVVYDTDLNTWRRHTIDGPRFIQTSEHREYVTVAKSLPIGCLYVRHTTAPDTAYGDAEQMRQDVLELGLAAGEVVLPESSANASNVAQDVAAVSHDMDASVRVYVQGMDDNVCGAAVDKEKVIQRTLGYLK